MKARFVRQVEGFKGDARLYAVDNPDMPELTHVVVSATTFAGDRETFIFAAEGDGSVKYLSELPGSFIGAWDHEKALRNAGYEVTMIEGVA